MPAQEALYPLSYLPSPILYKLQQRCGFFFFPPPSSSFFLETQSIVHMWDFWLVHLEAAHKPATPLFWLQNRSRLVSVLAGQSEKCPSRIKIVPFQLQHQISVKVSSKWYFGDQWHEWSTLWADETWGLALRHPVTAEARWLESGSEVVSLQAPQCLKPSAHSACSLKEAAVF